MRYRSEIDGLRAVAVLPVILFHAGFGVFSGGYVGVDIFFVISGYLITTILIEDLQRGDFSLLRFYERRARRILPALFFVMLCCLPFAWTWLYGTRMQDFAQSLIAVSLFASNFLFWRESGYFAPAAEEKPLLHTWSLAVEEQYYVLFPLLLMVLWRFGRDRVFWSILGISALSLILSEWGWRNWPSANFYLAPSRAWELLAGSIAAFIVQKHGVRGNEALSLLGLGAIVISIFAFDETTPFPSVYTLIPVLGVFLLILYADGETWAAKLLSNTPFVGIGLISYSAYLWHQPLFAFARIRSVGEPGILLMSALAGLSLLLAAFSWKYVEQPFRNGRNSIMKNRSSVFAISIAGLVAFAAVGYLGHMTKGFDFRLTDGQKQILAWEGYARDIPYREGDCFLAPEQSPYQFKDFCDGGGDILVWGDSHAAALSSGWLLLDQSISQYTASSCPPLIGRTLKNLPNCADVNHFVLDVIKERAPTTVYLHAHWTDAGDTVSHLRTTISALREVGATEIVILGSVPIFPPSLPQRLLSLGLDLEPKTKLHVNLERAMATDRILGDIAADSGATFISIIDVLCQQGFCNATSPNKDGGSDPITWDNAHLTVSGAIHTLQELQLGAAEQ